MKPGRLLFLLFLANLLNVYDRVIPGVLVESLRKEFGFSDIHIGIAGTAFTVVYALMGIPLGRLADSGSRTKVIGFGLIVWSAFTGMTALATGFVSFVLIRTFVGVGEAACAPAANALIADMYPPQQRSKAVGWFMLALPLGTILAFASVGVFAEWFGSWRAPFVIAAVPGLLLGAVMIAQPDTFKRVAKDGTGVVVARPLRTILSIRTMRWIILTGIGYNFTAYAVGTFMVPLLQRSYGVEMKSAALITGGLIGVTGLLTLSVGGWVADRVQQYGPSGRLWLCSVAMTLGASLMYLALNTSSVHAFSWLFAAGLGVSYLYIVCIYPSVQELVKPDLRATAMAVFFACFYLGGAAFGSAVVGLLSDHFADAARMAEGIAVITEAHRAIGLKQAMVLAPVAMLVGGLAAAMATRSHAEDVRKVNAI